MASIALDSGFRVNVTDIGASLVGIQCPEDGGRYTDVLLGCRDAASHWAQTSHLGALVGRNAGRIRNSLFSIDGEQFLVSPNHGTHHLHGGETGFTRRHWKFGSVDPSEPAISLSLFSPDGDEGYPGNLEVVVTYRLEEPAQLVITINGRSDKATLFNPTSHGYFNLDGHATGPISLHVLQIEADAFTPLDNELIPTGEIRPISGTPFDFTSPKQIDRDWAGLERGYDHNFVLRSAANSLRRAAILWSPISKRRMTVDTDRPCVHLYTGGYLDLATAKDGAAYGPFAGLCLETQGFPDAPNHADFPNAFLRPGVNFDSRTILSFDQEISE